MSIEKQIWDYLTSQGITQAGAAGLMGNLQAESGLISGRVEILCLKRLSKNGQVYNDATYTAAVDSGKISRARFLNPLPGKQYGYGLAQWTSPGRKAGLYDLVKARGVSIADLEAQLDYLIQELNNSYKSVLRVLKTAETVKEASDVVLTRFECPADCGASVKATRAKYGQVYFDKYKKEAGHMISNCGHDENGRWTGGKAGDQKGDEWKLIPWYNRPWKCVLRYPNAKVRADIAKLAKAAALNDRIGYDQGQRYTFWEHLKASNYKPSKITVACEADCSSGVAAIVKAVGYRKGIEALKATSIYLYTGNMRAALKAEGFRLLTETKYITGPDYLLPGDILLNDDHHVAINIDCGKKVSKSLQLKKGMKIKLTEDILIRTSVSTKAQQAGYRMYTDLSSSAKKKSKRVTENKAKLKKGNVVEALEVVTAWNGDTWIRIKNGWLPVCVKGKYRVVSA